MINKINQINDDQILNQVYELLKVSFEDTEIFHLSDNHKSAVEKAKASIDNRKYLTNEQANKEIGQLL